MENAAALQDGYKNAFQALGTIARTEGPKGLFRGLVPTVLATAPFSAFYYLFYTRQGRSEALCALADSRFPQWWAQHDDGSAVCSS